MTDYEAECLIEFDSAQRQHSPVVWAERDEEEEATIA